MSAGGHRTHHILCSVRVSHDSLQSAGHTDTDAAGELHVGNPHLSRCPTTRRRIHNPSPSVAESKLKRWGLEQLEAGASGAMCWYALLRHRDDVTALCRYSPAISLAICVGLGLDYDIFFSEAIKEKYDGLHDSQNELERIKESIAFARTTTGGIISAAGLIMIISSSPLLISNTLLLNEVPRPSSIVCELSHHFFPPPGRLHTHRRSVHRLLHHHQVHHTRMDVHVGKSSHRPIYQLQKRLVAIYVALSRINQ